MKTLLTALFSLALLCIFAGDSPALGLRGGGGGRIVARRGAAVNVNSNNVNAVGGGAVAARGFIPGQAVAFAGNRGFVRNDVAFAGINRGIYTPGYYGGVGFNHFNAGYYAAGVRGYAGYGGGVSYGYALTPCPVAAPVLLLPPAPPPVQTQNITTTTTTSSATLIGP